MKNVPTCLIMNSVRYGQTSFLFYSLHLKNNSLAYWLLEISERHTLTNDLFLDICRIKMIESLVESHKDLKLFTNNISLYIHFKKNTEVSFSDRFRFNFRKIFNQIKPYVHLIGFCAKTFIFRFRHVKKSEAKDLSNTIVIQTYVSADNFLNNEFRDNYYGNLAKYLREQGNKKVVTWPIFFMRPWSGNLGNNYYPAKALSSAVSHLRKNSDDFIIVEDYLSLVDYLETYKLFFINRFSDLGELEIEGTDYKDMLTHYLKKEIVEYGSLFYFFAKRLEERGYSKISFLINYENMKQQKSLIFGVRKFLPSSRVIGNFHTSKPKNLLSLDFANIDEYKIAPKPDLIIFNSPQFLNSFKENYSETPVINGMAFQQEYMSEFFRKQTQVFKEQNDKILVLFSGNREDIKLMFDLLRVIPKKYRLLFRMHPLHKFDPKKYFSGNAFEVVDNVSLIESLSEGPKVLSTYSSAALECAAMGMRVGLVYNRKRLLLNPFDFTSVENYSLISNNSQMLKFLSKPKPEYNLDPKDIFNIDERNYNLYLSSL